MEYFVIAWDNFYLSEDILTLDNIPKLIEQELELDNKEPFISRLFNWNGHDYTHYTLIKDNDTTYRLIVHFIDSDDDKEITLHKCKIYE